MTEKIPADVQAELDRRNAETRKWFEEEMKKRKVLHRIPSYPLLSTLLHLESSATMVGARHIHSEEIKDAGRAFKALMQLREAEGVLYGEPKELAVSYAYVIVMSSDGSLGVGYAHVYLDRPSAWPYFAAEHHAHKAIEEIPDLLLAFKFFGMIQRYD